MNFEHGRSGGIPVDFAAKHLLGCVGRTRHAMAHTTDRPSDFLRLFGRLANLGLFVVAALLVGLFLGTTADSLLGTRGVGAVGGLILGMAAGFREFYRIFAGMNAAERTDPGTQPPTETGD